MVDRVEMAAGERQQVAGLAVCVVDDGVEGRHAPEAGIVLVDHRHDIGTRVNIDPFLEHALAMRAFAEHRRWHDAPARGLRDEVGGDLAPGQGPDREVEQRALASSRLPDGQQVVGIERSTEVGRGRRCRPDPRHHGVVRRADEPADHLQLAVSQGSQDDVGFGDRALATEARRRQLS